MGNLVDEKSKLPLRLDASMHSICICTDEAHGQLAAVHSYTTQYQFAVFSLCSFRGELYPPIVSVYPSIGPNFTCCTPFAFQTNFAK